MKKNNTNLEDSNPWKEFKKLDRYAKKLIIWWFGSILIISGMALDDKFDAGFNNQIHEAVLWGWGFVLIMILATTNWSQQDENDDENQT